MSLPCIGMPRAIGSLAMAYAVFQSKPWDWNMSITSLSSWSLQCSESSEMHRSTWRLVMPLGLASSDDRTGPSSQISSRMLAICQERRAKGIAGVVGGDSTPSAGCRTHSPAGDSLSRMASGNTGTAVFVCATSVARRTSQAEETQAQ